MNDKGLEFIVTLNFVLLHLVLLRASNIITGDPHIRKGHAMDMVVHGFYRLKMKYWIWYEMIVAYFDVLGHHKLLLEKLWNSDARIILSTCLRTGLFWFLFDRCLVHLCLLQSIHITHPILYTHLINFHSEVICTIRLIFFFYMYIFKKMSF